MNNLQGEEAIPDSSSKRRKQQLEREQNIKQKKKMKLDELYVKMLQNKLRFVEENKGEIPALHFAARVSDVDVCKRLVEQGADVNEKCVDFGATPLHYAAMNVAHGESIIDYLVENGSEIDEEDAHRENATNYAVQAGNYWSALKLHNHSQRHNGGIATISCWLHFCIMQNLLQFAKIAFKDFKGQERLWERPYDRFYNLETACQFGDLEMCRWLLEEVEIDVNQFEENDWKDKVLGKVARNRKNEASKILGYLFSRFEFTADQQRNAYISAFLRQLGHRSFCAKEIEELFQRVADTKIKTEGKNLLQYCVSRNRLSAAKFVHEKDGDLINEISKDGATILFLAAQFGSVEMCQWLINQGQDIVVLNNKTIENFFHYAALNFTNGEDIIKTLARNFRGYVNQIDIKLFSPLHFAMINDERHNKVAEALLELGADLNVKWKGNNLLHFCIIIGKLESAKFVDAKDKNMIKQRGEGGKTTLHIAVDHFLKKICEWLVVKKGANPRELSVGGKSVLELTTCEEVKKILQSLMTKQESEIVS